MNQIVMPSSGTMSTALLMVLVNKSRSSSGESVVRASDFVARCADELEGEHYEIFVVQNPNKTSTTHFNLTMDQCKLVAMRESKSVRRSVLARLNELENPKVPQTLSQALRLAADQAEQIEQQKQALAIAAPKVEFVDQYVESTGSMTFRQVAKLLKAKEHALRQMLQDQKVMYKLGGEWTAYQNHIEAGRFEVKTGTAQHNDHAYTTARFTPKGVEYVSKLWRDIWLPKAPERASADIGKSMEKSQ